MVFNFFQIFEIATLKVNFIFLFLLLPMLINAQAYDSGSTYDTLGWEVRTEIGKQSIRDLRNGILIVRLKSGRNKIKAYQRMLDSPQVSAEKRQFFEIKMEEVKKEIRVENENLMLSINEIYSFSDVLFLMDTSVYLLKEKKQSGYFLDINMDIDPSISLNGGSYLIAYYGASSLATSNGEEGIVVMGPDFQELVSPFPHFTGITTTRKALGKIFEGRDDKYYVDLMIQRFNKRLSEFYDLND